MGSLSLSKALVFLTKNKRLEKLGLDEMQMFNPRIYILKYDMKYNMVFSINLCVMTYFITLHKVFPCIFIHGRMICRKSQHCPRLLQLIFTLIWIYNLWKKIIVIYTWQYLPVAMWQFLPSKRCFYSLTLGKLILCLKIF